MSKKEGAKNGTLLVFNHIEKGLSPSQLWKQNILPKRTVQRSLNVLRQTNSIKKIGYGTWEVMRYNVQEKEGATSYPYNPIPNGGYDTSKLPKNYIRGHAFRISLKIPNLRNWDNRKQLLKRLKIKYKVIPQGQRIIFKEFKVWLCNNSVVIIAPKGYSWFESTARRSKHNVIRFMFKLISQLERHIKVSSFKINNNYHIRFSRQHYALIKNELAEQYNDQKKKLYVYDWSGLWLIIDNSYNENEMETVHPRTADDDNKPVLDFFNDLKKNPVTPTQLLQIQQGLLNEQSQYRHDLVDYGKKISAHAQSIESLGSGIRQLTDKIVSLDLTQKKAPETRDLEHIELTDHVNPFVAEYKGILRDYPDLYPGARIWINKDVATLLINNGKATRV